MKRLIAVLAVFAVAAPAALAASHFLKVSPSTVKAGKSVTLSGSVGSGCAKGSQVTITSKAFKGATMHEFAGVPAVYATVKKGGKFSTKVTIKKAIKAGKYHVGGRCGGGNFGSATLKVT
jgi:hypothetical protein